ncbi:uncharacterized protein LOC111920975 isoform X2 [Lactuca sativa]|uniref:uncharacterized protein LOC111920975 isoform X2 n=1 Tax=Lactuca sativa TaxID=4236 RepID=UPI0022AECE6A|nr:uncharacterized protein LOC111920975 isoform X2 [Lactuca sativa]
MSVEIKLSRSNRTYRPHEPLQGKIITKFPSSVSHRGIHLTVNGSVNLQVRGGSAGLIESLYGVLKPIPILLVQAQHRYHFLLFSNIKKRIPNSMKLFMEQTLTSRQYLLTVDVVRGYLHKSFSATVEFIIESELGGLPEKPVSPETVFFYITQDTQRHSLLHELKSGGFKVSGRICTQCLVGDPLVGEVTVEASAVPIYSIDIHLHRIESIMVGEKIATETSVLQTTQIADGDVCRSICLPIYVILPRLLTCPTVFAGPFSVEFKVTIVVTFQTELYNVQPKSDPRAFRKWVAMESLPLELVQSQ